MVLFGTAIGWFQKELDGIGLNEMPEIVAALDIPNYFGGLSPWILICSAISVYSKNPLCAGINVVVFLLSMNAGYYWYSYHILGFLPRSYMMIWVILSFLSFFPAFVCWYVKGEGTLAVLISSVILGVLFSESVLLFQGIRMISLMGFIARLIGIVLLSRKPKEIMSMVGLSLVVAAVYQLFVLLFF